MRFYALFRTSKPVIGMLHVPALPGSPGHALTWSEIQQWVLRDAELLARGGVDGFILENFGDTPFYPNRVPAHTVAFLAALGHQVKTQFPLPLGINVLRNDALSAVAVAAAAGAEFIRVNVFTGARLTDQGIIQAEPHRVLRYRKLLGSDVLVLADVAVKHSTPLAARPLDEEVEETLLRARADAVIVTGSATGKAASWEDFRIAKQAAGTAPVLVGSGVDASQVEAALARADGLIVGTAVKRDAVTTNPVDADRLRALMELAGGRRR
jgi:hypothetical protein